MGKEAVLADSELAGEKSGLFEQSCHYPEMHRDRSLRESGLAHV